jgi:hypothetical protein
MKTQEWQIEVDGNNSEWEEKCLQIAEHKSPLLLINFTIEMVPIVHAIAKKHGYELKGRIPGACHFIPRNYSPDKMVVPKDFVFSMGSED